MDPKACLEGLLEAMLQPWQDVEIIVGLLESYREWRQKGGFEPTISGDRLFAILEENFNGGPNDITT